MQIAVLAKIANNHQGGFNSLSSDTKVSISINNNSNNNNSNNNNNNNNNNNDKNCRHF